MKKTFAILLALVMIVALFAGCGAKKEVAVTLPAPVAAASDLVF